MQIVLTREHQSVPWGFRLKGGAEYNVPLSILKVNPSSPAYNKLEFGDVISSIGNYSALYLKHEEALNIIRLFDYHLPLCIKREAAVNTTPANSLYWRPNQEDTIFNALTPKSTQFSSSYQHLHPTGPVWPQNNSIYDNKQLEQNHQHVDLQQQSDQIEDQRSADWLSQYNYQPIFQQTFPIGLQQENAPPLVVPPALIKAMTGSPLGKKPFTYTPGGLDLSHIRESSRVKRYDVTGTYHETRPVDQNQNLRSFTPSFGDNGEVITTEQIPIRQKLRPVNGKNQDDYSGISHEHLVRPNKHKDLVNQSISFRMLNRWIHDHEGNPILESEEPRRANTEKLFEKSEVLKVIETENNRSHPESGVDRTSYVKYNAPLSPYSRLLKLKAQVDRSLGKTVKPSINNKAAVQITALSVNSEEKERVPASQRYQEREISKFRGENIPSRTFKYLQFITQEELALEQQEEKLNLKKKQETANSVNQPVVQNTLNLSSVTFAKTEPTATIEKTREQENDVFYEAQTEIQEEEAPKESKAEAPQESQVEAPQESQVEAPQESQVEAPQESQVEAPQESQVETLQESQAEAPQESQVEAPQELQVEAPQELKDEKFQVIDTQIIVNEIEILKAQDEVELKQNIPYLSDTTIISQDIESSDF